MLVSALLTSVGINSALCVLFFVLYSILKKQPGHYEVYVPRLLAEGNSKRRSRFNLERLIPSTGWLSKAWKVSEEEMLSSSGLDAVVYMRIITFRIAYFYSLKPQPNQFTILVRNIPVSVGSSVSDSVESFFTEYHPTTYLSHIVVRRTSKVRSLINDAKQLSRRLLHLQSEPSEQKYKRVGLLRQKVDLLDHYGKRLEDLEQNVRLEQSESHGSSHCAVTGMIHINSSSSGDTRAAFVSFKSRYGASTVFHLQQSINPTHWLTEEAPEPNDVVPPIMEFLSSIQGYISHSEIERSACNKVLWFTIWNIFFATVFSGSILNQISIFLDPKHIPAKLAIAVPAQASFFVAYVVTSGWTSTSSELFRMIPLICSLITKCCAKSTDEEIEVPSIPYHRDIPRVLFFGLLVGIFTLKKLSLASTLIFPLPVLTLLFNEYCRKRFLPIFIAYSAEVLIKKDREDQNDATMSEFFDKLATAYQDPALMPIQHLHSAERDSLNRPLISSAEV
ncbi:unnamed protein product [Dovyalis caffra]|uniref:CSC1-like protein n=1 Tax=Dovyalis caffra TaxID=77055 RepID=A0AAV1QYI7_9ROSI|nr:unnamed protein product [Dovyalis caffra]